MPLTFSFIFWGSLIISFFFNSFLLRYFKTLGVASNQAKGLERWTNITKPSVGGICFAFLLLIAYIILIPLSNFKINFSTHALVFGTLTAFVFGFLDDRYQLKPLTKFGGQFLVAHIFFFGGLVININHFDTFNYFITIFWVVGILNSINMLDNMDGVTATASVTTLVICLMVAIITNNYNNATFILGLVVLAALLGFMIFNYPPAKMYMGDGGSQFLGAFLAAFSILYIWHFKNAETNNFLQFRQFAIPLLAFLIPIIDTSTVTVRRLLRGQSPFIGGRDHTTHQLAIAGLSNQQVIMLFSFIGLVSTLIVYYLINNISTWKPLYTILCFCWFAILIISIQWVFLFNKKKHLKK